MGHVKGKRKPTAIDLFSGCGGLTAGLKSAGFEVIGAVELDDVAVETYMENHPAVSVWHEDIRQLPVSHVSHELGLRRGGLDLLSGCPPCQGFSTLRTMNGAYEIEDLCNDLLFEFLRFANVLRPKAVMMENVPGLAKDERFAHFCERMESFGYTAEHRVLNAADYGVPQRRRRLIYLAGHGFKIPFAKVTKKRRTVRDAIAGLPKAGQSGDLIHDIPENRTKKVLSMIRRIPKDGGSRKDLPKKDQLACHQESDGFKDVYGRMAWDDVAPTLTSGCFNPSKGRFLHPEEDRAITMREAALLQGFRRGYKFPVTKSKSELALMIGNALPAPFICAHAKAIRKQWREE